MASSLSDAIVALALLKEALAHPPLIGALPIATHSRKKPRKPKNGNELSASAFRPHVLARD
jgi:hypothetical protein